VDSSQYARKKFDKQRANLRLFDDDANNLKKTKDTKMALVECHECKKQISSEAIICPHCGYCAKKQERRDFLLG
jgi:hypothetical protein